MPELAPTTIAVRHVFVRGEGATVPTDVAWLVVGTGGVVESGAVALCIEREYRCAAAKTQRRGRFSALATPALHA
jgi:hypothetical protein